jgi:methionyl-tRNA synthetase
MHEKTNKFYITTPIYYVNDKPHIGHTYTTVLADFLARYSRISGNNTYFLTGTDEHGLKIEEKSRISGKEPKEFSDEVAAQFQLSWQELDISNDNFIRTTDEFHVEAVRKALEYLHKKGDIYLGEYEGLYCTGCEQFLNEKDLIEGLCPDHRVAPQIIREESYMFKLSKYEKDLLRKIKNAELIILPVERKNEIINFIEREGLKDVSFSRKKVKWGIPLAWDQSHTTYVWADALLNYLTGIHWNGDPKLIPALWPPDVQLMSKDILRIHATIWPAMLLALGIPLPKTLFIHGYFLINGQKMSKTIGNVIAPGELVSKYGVDGTRYLLLSSASFGRDSDISWNFLDEKYNADLANGLGNLVARSIALAIKASDAGLKLKKNNAKTENWDSHPFHHSVSNIWEVYHASVKQLKAERTLEIIFGSEVLGGMIKFLDNYITTVKPWELIKNKDARTGTVIYNILERLRHTALMLLPFMPGTSEKIFISLGIDTNRIGQQSIKELSKWGGLKPDTKVQKAEILFPRIIVN